MEIPTYWPQVLTIVIANISILLAIISMFLWATRQARSDYLHMDKKFEDNRKEMNEVLNKFTMNINILLNNFENRLQKKE